MHPLTKEGTRPAGSPTEAVEGSIDEDSISQLNARISQAAPVQLTAGEEEISGAPANIDDSQLAQSLNQRLRELSGPSDEAFSGVLTGLWLSLVVASN